MRKRIDLTGQVFGLLTVVGFAPKRPPATQAFWACSCACGNTKNVRSEGLRRGDTTSCGCATSAIRSERSTKHGHGYSTPEYRSWACMVQRCTNPSNTNYPNYGGRGIAICDRWRDSFAAFLEDVGPRPPKNHTLDRIDNAKGYEPGNCRWATVREQQRNKRTNRVITIAGVSRLLVEWCEVAGLRPSTVQARLKAGWPIERAVTVPSRGRS